MIKKLKLFVLLFASLFVVASAPVYAAEECGGAKTQIVSCDGKGVAAIGELIRIAVTVMTVIIGIVATGGIAYAAILYASARDNQSKVTEALTMLRNIVIGLLLYGFTVAIINWLVPGGVIG